MSLCGWDVLKLRLSLKPRNDRKMACEWPRSGTGEKWWEWGKAGFTLFIPPSGSRCAKKSETFLLSLGSGRRKCVPGAQWQKSNTHASIVLTFITDSIGPIFSVNFSKIAKCYSNSWIFPKLTKWQRICTKYQNPKLNLSKCKFRL